MPAKVKSGNTPKVRVTVDGQALPQSAIRRVSVDRAVDMADMFTVDLRNDQCQMSDNPLLEPGKTLQVELGYQEAGGKFIRTIVGRIVALKGIFPRRGPMGLRVQGYSPNQLLMQGRRTRRFTNVKYSEVVERVLAAECYQNKLIVEVEDTGQKHEYVFQRNQTDMEFLMELAERVGYELSITYHDSDPNAPAKLFFGKPKLESTPVRTLKKGENLLAFFPKTRTALAPTGVTVMSWDPDERKVIVGEAEGGESPEDEATKRIGPYLEEVHELPVRSEDEADEIAVAIMQRRALEFIHAEALLSGNPDLTPGVVVEVKGVGPLFSRTYYVTRVIHDLHDGGFNTRIELRSVTLAQETPEPQPVQAGGAGGAGGPGQAGGPSQSGGAGGPGQAGGAGKPGPHDAGSGGGGAGGGSGKGGAGAPVKPPAEPSPPSQPGAPIPPPQPPTVPPGKMPPIFGGVGKTGKRLRGTGKGASGGGAAPPLPQEPPPGKKPR